MSNRFFRQDREKDIDEQMKNFNHQPMGMKVSASLSQNIEFIQQLFCDVDIMRYREVENQFDEAFKCLLVFSDGMVDSKVINDNIIRPLTIADLQGKGEQLEELMAKVLQSNEVKTTESFLEIVEAVTYGDSALFVEGSDKAVLINTKHFPLRSIEMPDNERTLSGPREGFNESLMQNLSLIRRRLRTHELKIKNMTLGRRTKTAVSICYMANLVKYDILDELNKRIKSIDIDGVLDANYITEIIRDNRFSPFRSTGYTEKPDSIVGKLLEGRIAIFVDGTPQVLTVPYLFIENFQSPEDYYLNYYYTSFSRLLRIFGYILTVSVPGFYIAIIAFHKEMLPTPLLINLVADRLGVPFPAAIEAFVMIIIFDILRETGVRMPSNVGQALSIVGALVIGQAAVQAKLVSSPMIIVIAITGITSLLVPKMNAPIIYSRFFVLALSTMFGLFGFAIGMSFMFIHILNLNSLGVEQVALSGKMKAQENKDALIRAPWWTMKQRPDMLTSNRTRQTEGDGNA